MANFTLDEFQATLRNTARTNRFEAEIYSPKAVSEYSRKVSIRIDSVSFPGKNIRTVTNENVYGPTYEVAQGLTYAEEINIGFYMNNNHEERWFFNDWQDKIINPRTYNVAYYDQYVSKMRVFQLDEANNRTCGIEIRDVFPKTVNGIDYSHSDANNIVKGSVGLAFKEWVPIYVDATSGAIQVDEAYDDISSTRRGVSSPVINIRSNRGIRQITEGVLGDSFPPQRITTPNIVRQAGQAFNDVLEARNQVVQAQQKVVAFKNFFQGVTRRPFGNLGIKF